MPTCNPELHWFERTPPRPYDPPGFTAQDARCVCGQFQYSEHRALVKVGTFVAEPRRGRKPRAEAAALPFLIRLSPAERARLEAAARANRQQLADFARDALVTAADDCLER